MWDVNDWVNRYVYLKFVWGRGRSHVDTILSIVSTIFSFAVLVKLYQLPDLLVPIIGVGVLVVTFILGYYDVRKGVADKETSIANLHNPQIVELLKRSEDK